MSRRPIAIVGIGGNALTRPGDVGTLTEQLERGRTVARLVLQLFRRGYRVVLVHGNGPQVGRELLRQERAAPGLWPAPLDVCVAATQGTIAHALALALQRERPASGRTPSTATLMTHVRVDRGDPALTRPTKPVGGFMTEVEANTKARERGWQVAEDAGRGWRRLVPSPLPVEIIDLAALRALLERVDVVIAGGGGGIPVARAANGDLVGVEAVIDKDRTATLIGRGLRADRLFSLTAVARVSLFHGTPRAVALDRVDVTAMTRYHAEGHFAAGSMGPKIEAALDFVRHTGGVASIGEAHDLLRLLDGRAGTHIVPNALPGLTRGGSPGSEEAPP